MRNQSAFFSKSTSRAIFLLACVCLVGARASAQASAAPAQAAPPYAEARANADKIGNELMARGIPGLADRAGGVGDAVRLRHLAG